MENTLVNSTMSNQTQIVNYALNGKLLDTQESGRSLVVTPASNNSGALSLPIILVLIFIMASIVGIIVTALFVMRRRFSTWRLSTNDSKEVDAETGAKVELKESEVDVKPTEKTADVKTETETQEKAAPTVDTNQEGDKQEQPSPSSNAPLIAESTDVPKTETVAEATKTEEAVSAEAKVGEESAAVKPTEQVTSSSSLIVNVLNELSESVACKLAGEVAPSAEEKEPLNTETAATDATEQKE